MYLPMKHSIGAKVFAAFLAMGMISGALGVYGLYVLSAAGHLVVDTYDRPMMAIDFARSASLTFALMDKDVLRRKLAPKAAWADIDADLEQRSTSFFDDLSVAEQRSLANDERVVIQDIRRLVTAWNILRQSKSSDEAVSDAALDVLAKRIVDRFDVLIELIADHSFIERRKAVWSIANFTTMSIAATALGLLLSAAITLLLTRHIIRPLAAAANVADRIAGGEFETSIPQGGRDETGKLLRSMSVMQASIRAMMQRETDQRRSAQSRLIDAIECSREGLILVDVEGTVVIANSQLSRFFPTVAPFIVAGANFNATLALMRLQLAQPGDLNEFAHARMARQPQDGRPFEGEFRLTDGRWIRVSRSETHDGGYFLFLSDFTDIKEREEHYKEAKLEAEAASGSKSIFLANMSHELRTPLNAIIGFSEIMAGQIFGAIGNQRYLEYSGLILKSGRHLLDIITSVLDLAKSEAGKLDLRAEQVDLREIVDECAEMLRDECARAHQELVVELSPLPLTVIGEPAKLRQIVLNLLSNAIKFSEPGGTISIVAAPNEDGYIELAIADTGIGMSAAEIPIALAPFGQVESGLARRYEGTGLGLPLTRALVELHAGTMTIASAHGMGTTVTVSLPQICVGAVAAMARA
jgi:signal transduction histidine kinase/HAMP domain-containing protein